MPSLVSRCLAALLAGTCGLAVAGEPGCGDGAVTAAAAQAAIDLVERSLVDSHVGSAQGLDATTRAALADARQGVRGGTTERELIDAINRALVPLRDGHLEVRMNDDAARGCARLPVEFEWSGAGLWLRDGTPELPAGSKVLRLGGLDVADLESALARLVPHEVPQWVRANGVRRLGRADTLATLGVLRPDATVELAVLRPDGKQARARLRLVRPAAQSPAPPWVGYRIFAPQRTGWFWFDRFDYDEELSRQLDAFLEAASKAGVTKVAIDVRGNPGGDSSVAVAMLDAMGFEGYQAFAVEPRPSPALAEGIPPLMPEALNPVLEQVGVPTIPPDAKTYVLPPPLVLAQLRDRVTAHPLKHTLGRKPDLYLLTDAGTFSSGTLFAVLVRDNRLGRLVGEAPGNSATFNGTEFHVALPGLPYFLNLTMARLHRVDTAAGDDRSIDPDVLLPVTGADIAAGRDRALDYVLAAP